MSFKKFATADDNNGVDSDGVATGPLSASYKNRREAFGDVKSGNESGGYYNASYNIKHGKNEPKTKADYVKTHAVIKKMTGGKDSQIKDYLDSKRGRHLVGKEQDKLYVKKDFSKWIKTYNPNDYRWESVEQVDEASRKKMKIAGRDVVVVPVSGSKSEFYYKWKRKDGKKGYGEYDLDFDKSPMELMAKEIKAQDKKDGTGSYGRQFESVEQTDEGRVSKGIAKVKAGHYDRKANKSFKKAKTAFKTAGQRTQVDPDEYHKHYKKNYDVYSKQSKKGQDASDAARKIRSGMREESVEQVDEAMVNQDRYKRSHGKDAKGEGRWSFTTMRTGTPNEKDVVTATGKLGDVAKIAQRQFKGKDIYVMESVEQVDESSKMYWPKRDTILRINKQNKDRKAQAFAEKDPEILDDAVRDINRYLKKSKGNPKTLSAYDTKFYQSSIGKIERISGKTAAKKQVAQIKKKYKGVKESVEQVEEAYFTVQFRDEKGKADSSSKSFKNASAAKKHADVANKTTKVGSYSVQKVQGRMESVEQVDEAKDMKKHHQDALIKLHMLKGTKFYDKKKVKQHELELKKLRESVEQVDVFQRYLRNSKVNPAEDLD